MDPKNGFGGRNGAAFMRSDLPVIHQRSLFNQQNDFN